MQSFQYGVPSTCHLVKPVGMNLDCVCAECARSNAKCKQRYQTVHIHLQPYIHYTSAGLGILRRVTCMPLTRLNKCNKYIYVNLMFSYVISWSI